MKAITLLLFIICCQPAHAADKCQDPETLPANLKQAYYQLKKLEKETGMKVSIRCKPVTK